MSPLRGLQRCLVARGVGDQGQALQLRRQLGEGEVLLMEGVQVGQVPVHRVVLQHRDPRPHHKLPTHRCLGGGGGVQGGVGGGRGGLLLLVGVVDAVHPRHLLPAGPVRRQVAPRQIVRDDGGHRGFTK